MMPLVTLMLLLGTPPDKADRSSYLFQFEKGRLVGRPYQPQAGDLALLDDHHEITAQLYNLCNTGKPLHAAIIFHKPDGTPAVLEAGRNGVLKVFVTDAATRMQRFDGTILIRRLRKPLTPEQSKQLTDFAMAQDGKPYALSRAILHASPLRPRDPGIMRIFNRTVLDREGWICSELAVAAATAAGVLNETDHPANMMLPRDLCYDERYDLSPQYEPPALWYPRASIDHVGNGIRVGNPE
ncbi:MAG TPA: YiiX/YebB-like N1pC/P60 family cysteine hydrolase [Gemmataceae bacterium]|nr:YiiX/YebB-like N1pC/P60 family cysteine hydrolase [Gemmataceae bacterium]